MKNISRCKCIALFFVSIITLGCDSENNALDTQINIVLSSPTVNPGGSLSINATARFDVEVTGLLDSPSLIYEWSVGAARGTLIIPNQAEGNQAQTPNSYIMLRGDKAGSETIIVKVKNEATGNYIGEDALPFEITESTSTSSCFDEPLLFYRNNNWNSPAVVGIGLESDTRKINRPPSNNWLFDISKDGKWFLRQDYSDIKNYEIWMDACDGSERKKLAEGLQIFSPTFGPNDKYIYYSELISYPEQTQDPRARELVEVNIETGEKVFVSELKVFSGDPQVSPDGNWIAFEHSKPTFNANGSFAGSIVHLAVMPRNGGPAQLLVLVESNDLAGFDWSPDSKDLIFNWHKQGGSSATHTNGIYRVNINGGGGASLVFAEPDGDGRPIYYANGTRIAFHGHANGSDTQYDIWSIDANGNDLKRLSDEQYNVFLSFIWEP